MGHLTAGWRSRRFSLDSKDLAALDEDQRAARYQPFAVEGRVSPIRARGPSAARALVQAHHVAFAVVEPCGALTWNGGDVAVPFQAGHVVLLELDAL